MEFGSEQKWNFAPLNICLIDMIMITAFKLIVVKLHIQMKIQKINLDLVLP